MAGYQQLFALTKNPKYVKMNPPGKTGRSSELNNTANAGRIVRSRNGRKILPAFLLTVFVAALATAAIPQEKQASRGKHAIQGFPPAAVYQFCGDTPETTLLASG